jgi:hypothetical protein
MIDVLKNIIDNIDEVLGDYAPIAETSCPEWALSLKEAQGKVIEAIERIEVGGINDRLEKLWREFCLWDCNAKCASDDDAEKYARYKGARDHKIISFMAFVAARSVADFEEEKEARTK